MRKTDPFEERPRKVHYFADQNGAKIPHSGKPFANTLCKMNSNVPGTHITTIPHEVTCKLCRQHKSFKHILNAQYGKFSRQSIDYDHVVPKEQAERIAKVTPGLHTQMFGRILRPKSLNGRETRYRRTWTGKLVLQVETSYNNADPRDPLVIGQTFMRWRDATLADLDVGVV